MKVKIIFDMDNPEDVQAHKRCIKSLDMSCMIFELLNNQEKTITQRYENRKEYEKAKVVSQVFENIRDLANEYDI